MFVLEDMGFKSCFFLEIVGGFSFFYISIKWIGSVYIIYFVVVSLSSNYLCMGIEIVMVFES